MDVKIGLNPCECGQMGLSCGTEVLRIERLWSFGPCSSDVRGGGCVHWVYSSFLLFLKTFFPPTMSENSNCHMVNLSHKLFKSTNNKLFATDRSPKIINLISEKWVTFWKSSPRETTIWIRPLFPPQEHREDLQNILHERKFKFLHLLCALTHPCCREAGHWRSAGKKWPWFYRCSSSFLKTEEATGINRSVRTESTKSQTTAYCLF